MAKALSTLPVGATLEVPVKAAYQSYLGKTVVFRLADKNHTGYPTNAATLITDKIVSVLAFDAIEAKNSDSNRRRYGNNRYLHANLLGWLNSKAAAGKWYSAQHSADEPPTAANVWTNFNPYDNKAGFLAMLDDNFVDALMNTTVTTAKNTVTDGGGYEIVTSKMFLASTTEIGSANENSIMEGSRLALFTTADTTRLAYPTAQCVSNSSFTEGKFNTSSAWYWWLRTPNSANSYNVRYVYNSGALYDGNAFRGYFGVRPLCNLLSSILVSDTTNANGNYEFAWNEPPSTPSGISVPESCYSGQDITVEWGASTDPDGDAITYVLERSTNNSSYTQATTTTGRTFTETVSKSWNTLHYRVKARDSFGNESAYTTSSIIAVIHNQPPVISGQNTDLGTKSDDFTHDYTVTDPDGDSVTVVEAVDNNTLRKFTATLGDKNTLKLGGHDFTALSNSQHTIKITATDTAGNITPRTLTFKKLIKGFVITLSKPLEAMAQPRRAKLFITRDIPEGGKLKVEVSNNPFDIVPRWEDCTNAVLKGVAHVFENNVNAAVVHGLNIRVTVERGDALSTCWVSGIGGNFE